MTGMASQPAAGRAGVLAYRLLATVHVTHDYFAGGRPPRMLFSPHAATAAFLRRFDMRMLADGPGFGIGVCDGQRANIWSERVDEGAPRALCFDVRSADPEGAYYTEAVTASAQAAGDGVRVPPLLPVEPSASAPLATLALPLNPGPADDFASWDAAACVSYRLCLRSPATIWKYVLAGDWQGRKLAVVDPRGEVAFTPPASECMPDGSTALATYSSVPIALRERPAQRFQLHDVTDVPGRILMPRLPGARPRGRWREMQGSAPVAVSEIFVHS
jgi:hypothetical protein